MAGVVEKVEVRAEEMVASEKERANSISLERQENDTAKSMALRAILSAEDAEWIADVPPEEQRRIFQKVDMRLVPMLALLYLIAAGIAFMIAVGNLGGLPGSFIFVDRESPKYPTGLGSSLSFAAAGLISAFVLEFLYWMHNTRNAAVTEEEAIAKYGEENLARMGDKSPLFSYSY